MRLNASSLFYFFWLNGSQYESRTKIKEKGIVLANTVGAGGGHSEYSDNIRYKVPFIKEAYNEKETQVKLRLPDLKIVITGTQFGYKRPDGVLVVPIGALKE